MSAYVTLNVRDSYLTLMDSDSDSDVAFLPGDTLAIASVGLGPIAHFRGFFDYATHYESVHGYSASLTWTYKGTVIPYSREPEDPQRCYQVNPGRGKSSCYSGPSLHEPLARGPCLGCRIPLIK